MNCLQKSLGAVFLFVFGAIVVINIVRISDNENIDAKIDKKFKEENKKNLKVVNSNYIPLAVVGNDDRISRDNINPQNSQILKSIGGIGIGEFIDGKWVLVSFGCTGTLYNSNIIITAAHCIQNTIDNQRLGELKSNIVFIPNMINMKSDDIMIISRIIRSKTYPRFGMNSINLEHDWVILISEKNAPLNYISPLSLSDNTNTYPYSGYSNEKSKSFLNLIGYAADRLGISIHENTIINKKQDNIFMVDSDMNPGSSGGPMIETVIDVVDNSISYIIHAVVSGHQCLENEFIGVNCYTNKINSFPNILTPIKNLKEILEQYLLDTEILNNNEIININLRGPTPTNTPTPTPTNTPTPDICKLHN